VSDKRDGIRPPMRVFLVWKSLIAVLFIYILTRLVPLTIRVWSSNTTLGLILSLATTMTLLMIALQAYAIVRVLCGPQSFQAADFTTAAAEVNVERIQRAMAQLEPLGGDWWPPVRSSIEDFLSMPPSPKKWQSRAELLTTLYAIADHGPMPLEVRRKVNDVRRAINLEIDAA